MYAENRFPNESGRDFAMRVLKERIIHLDLEPGAAISENEVADELGLSRTPVREAFIELAKVKILEIYPQRKSVVSLIDYDLIEEARFLRSVLEREIVALDCELATDANLALLRENLQLQNFYLENFSAEKLHELDDDFHHSLFDIARMPNIYRLMQSFSVHFDRVRSMSLTVIKDLHTVQDHESIVDAIAHKNAAEAQRIMDMHLSRYKTDAAAIKARYPHYIKN